MESQTFTNNRTTDEFTKVNEGYEIKNTVYNNVDDKIVLRSSDYLKYLAQIELTKEVLDEELTTENKNLFTAKSIIIPKIADNLDLVKYVDEKKILNSDDYFIMFLNLIILFNDTINTQVMDYLVAKEEDRSKSFLKNPYILKAFIQLLEKCEENAFLLADWYYKTDKVIFANMIGNLIHGDKKEKILTFLEKYDDIFDVDECVLIQSMCISYKLEEIQKYLEKVKCENLPYQKLASFSLRNKDENVFLYWNKLEKFKCDNIIIALSCVVAKKSESARVLVENFEGEIKNEEVIQQCAEANNTDLVKFIVENLSSKIDLHAKNDLLLRTMVINENLEAVKFLLDNEDKFGKFNNQDLPTKLKKIMRFLENQELVNIVKKHFSL